MASARKPHRRSRKPRYISLSRHLARCVSPEPTAPMAIDYRQLELFPLHPEPIRNRDRGDDDDREVNYASRFLDLQCDALNSILGPAVELDQEPGPARDLDPHGAIAIERVLRGRERWEFCNEEDEEEAEEGEGSSGAGSCDTWWDAPARVLSLKLDYDEIMTAWSDKGPLYVDGEGAQVVPSDPRRRHLCEPSSVFVDVGGGSNYNSSSCSSNLWAVPENCEGSGGGREARVLRYKEKRRSRLFAKKIRYEVRKLNAEKRPRIKGRFVKRVE